MYNGHSSGIIFYYLSPPASCRVGLVRLLISWVAGPYQFNADPDPALFNAELGLAFHLNVYPDPNSAPMRICDYWSTDFPGSIVSLHA